MRTSAKFTIKITYRGIRSQIAQNEVKCLESIYLKFSREKDREGNNKRYI